ncbi:MAG: BON domain-containing protein [Nitrospirota bacterium]|jgi:osmotically-inducible protein OsmY
MQRHLAVILCLLAVVAMVGCRSLTGKSAGETIDDATITTKVNAIIVKDPSAAFLKIDVDTRQGHVSLSGIVPDGETEDRLVERIRQVKGVKSVESNLKVEPRE